MAYVILNDKATDITIYRADKLDVSGNPRHIVHFRDFLTDEEWRDNDILTGYEIASKKIKKSHHHWRKYSCREFGGGFITQGDYAGGRETLQEVIEIKAITL